MGDMINKINLDVSALQRHIHYLESIKVSRTILGHLYRAFQNTWEFHVESLKEHANSLFQKEQQTWVKGQRIMSFTIRSLLYHLDICVLPEESSLYPWHPCIVLPCSLCLLKADYWISVQAFRFFTSTKHSSLSPRLTLSSWNFNLAVS